MTSPSSRRSRSPTSPRAWSSRTTSPIDDRSLVTHRVVSVETGPDGTGQRPDQGRRQRRRSTPGPRPSQGDTAYEVRAVIPELGHVIQALRTPVVTQVLLYGAPALLAGWLLLTIWRPTRERRGGRPA